MSYIGNTSTTQTYNQAISYFNGNGSTTAFTLPYPVASAAQLIVTVNNVVQNPSSAFTISGSTLTFTSAPSSGTSNIWVEYASPVTQTVAPSAGSVNQAQIGALTNLPLTSGILGGGNSSTLKNRIINGAMVIDQRNAGASVNVTTSNTFVLDRWKFEKISSCTYTAQQSSTAPTGFSYSSAVTVGTGAASGASEYVRVIQPIEGFNTADLGWGTANAQTVTVSFWVRSSIAGTYCLGLQNSTTNYSYPVNYTISAANTWQYITLTIPGPTSGAWVGATNGAGIICVWDLGSGSNWNGTASTWQSGNTWKTTSQTALTATSGATFYVTGVQLEVGAVATGFEYRQYGTELALCQRYYQRITSESVVGTFLTGVICSAATSGNGPVQLMSPMRTTPTLSDNSAASTFNYSDGTVGTACTAVGLAGSQSNSRMAAVNFTTAGGLTQYRPYRIEANGTASAYLGFSAEL